MQKLKHRMPGNKKTKKHRKSVPAFGSFTKGDKLLSFSVRKALLAFKEGKGTPVDWFTICHRLSICLSLIEEHYIEQSLKEMNDSIDSFKNKLPTEISTVIKTINLTSLCSKREKLMRGEDLTKRKQDQELPCLICN